MCVSRVYASEASLGASFRTNTKLTHWRRSKYTVVSVILSHIIEGSYNV